jgi:hypothetical protein
MPFHHKLNNISAIENEFPKHLLPDRIHFYCLFLILQNRNCLPSMSDSKEMIENNRLEQSFGPVGTTAGTIVFAAGLILSFTHISGLILVLIGAFVGFSNTSVQIDDEKNRIRYSNNLFGFIRRGQWLLLQPAMKLGIKESNVVWRSYSSGSRALDISKTDHLIVLFIADNKEIMPIKKIKSREDAVAELESLKNKLGLISI